MPAAIGTYDVVIVGGGVAGAVTAKVLAERALQARRAISILILESGPPVGLSADSYAAYLNQYYAASLKTPNAPYPNSINAPSPEDIAALKPPAARYFQQKGPLPFGSTNLRALGGTTLHWMGIALRMLPSDFKMKTLYGRGVDWPMQYDDLRPYYEMAEWEIGVSATRSELEQTTATQGLFGNYEFPMQGIPVSYLDKWLSRGLRGFQFSLNGEPQHVQLVPIPHARNGVPTTNLGKDPRRYIDANRRATTAYLPYGSPDDPSTGRGQRCEGNASCIPICPVQAKYTALKTIRQLLDLSAQPGISIRLETRAVATQLDADTDGRIAQVRYLQYESEQVAAAAARVTSGRRVVLAGSAIENAKLLLASRCDRFPCGISNENDLVGRHLMDHPFMLSWAEAPKGVQLGTFRGPGVTSDLPMRDGSFRRVQAAFRTDVSNWGWGLADDAPSRDLDDLIDPPSPAKGISGAALRSALRKRVQRQITLGFLVEQLPMESNRVEIDDRWRDALGVHRPVIKYDISDYTRAGMVGAAELATAVFKQIHAAERTNPKSKLGTPITCRGRELQYIGAGHIMGTHRMGKKPGDSVVNEYQRSWKHDNLYIVGCGSMPTAGTSNPTLTAVALCIRSAEQLFKELDLAHR